MQLRPINLTSAWCKLMEKMIFKELLSFTLQADIITNTQHGFLPDRSVITCFLYFLNPWTSDASDPVDVVYLDFKKDRVPSRRLLGKVDHLAIRGKVLN